MADWEFATGDAMTRKAWGKQFWIEARTESYFYENGLVSKDATNAIIVELPDLNKEQGDKITYGEVRELSGGGILNDADAEGSEEVPDVYDDDVTLLMVRNAVRTKGKMSGKRPSDNGLRKWAITLLRRWMGGDIDQRLFTALGTSSTKAIYGGDATSTATIEAGDYMTLYMISKGKTYAKKASPKLVGPKYRGQQTNGIVCISPDQAHDLTEYDASWNQNQMEARLRGKNNPVFTGALGMKNMCPIHEHERIPLATTWGSGSNLNGASAFHLFVGAGVIAYGIERIWNEKTFDYGNKVGFCIGAMFGISKTVMNSVDHGLLEYRTYRSNN